MENRWSICMRAEFAVSNLSESIFGRERRGARYSHSFQSQYVSTHSITLKA